MRVECCSLPKGPQSPLEGPVVPVMTVVANTSPPLSRFEIDNLEKGKLGGSVLTVSRKNNE